jgi:hypothetical protein
MILDDLAVQSTSVMAVTALVIASDGPLSLKHLANLIEATRATNEWSG